MTVPEFANHYRLKLSHDECGDPIIPGRLGKDANISDYNDVRDADKIELAMCWLTDGQKSARSGLWTRTKTACLAAGMTLHQDGDAEGIMVFDPTDPVQAKLAIKSIRAKLKRQMTTERRAALSVALAKARFARRVESFA